VLDRLTGELRFGDGQAGLVPPQGGRNVRMSYEYGGGSVGNRLTHDIIQMKTAVPYVVGVTNWEPATGGAERETLDAVGERGPRTLRHRDRAVVASDFEDLALEASSEVARARSIGAAGVITSRNEYARPLVQPTSLGGGAVGQVLVVVVPESTDPRPTPSLRLLGELTDYLRRRATATADVRVTGPDWLRVTVEADVVPDVSEHATEVKTAVLTRLAAYLHPLSGGPRGRGWEFGRQPYRSDLLALVESVPGVSHIRRLQARTRYDQPDQGVGLFLVYSGAHQITMTGPSGGTDGTAPA
jgi:predicted phage baseplate assembly protein